MKRILFWVGVVVLALVLAAVVVWGQEARVIALDVKDSRVAHEAWDNLQRAQGTWNNLQEVLRDKYTVVPEGNADAGNTMFGFTANGTCLISNGTSDQVTFMKCGDIKDQPPKPLEYYRKGFENGFEFSSDFKYIVPKRVEPNPHGPAWNFFTGPYPANTLTLPTESGTMQLNGILPVGSDNDTGASTLLGGTIVTVGGEQDSGSVSLPARSFAVGGCDESLWNHVYHPDRLTVHNRCASITGTIVDATHGRRKDGVRKEADGDCHGWLKLDDIAVTADQGPATNQADKFLNAGNKSDEDGNLVFEVVCMFPVTQADAKSACANYHNKIKIPRVGSHVRITGSWVMDDNHAHWNEIHPVSSIEVLP